MLEYENFIIIVSSPSGAGKSTLCSRLLEDDERIKMSVSATTRAKREGEEDGIHYHFITKEEFDEQVKNDGFIEYAQVYDNYYGTLKSQVEEKWKNNNDLILDIDWQGARNVSDQLDRKRLLKIFILPPSIAELRNRLVNRATDDPEVIEKRLNKAKDDISHYNEYDYIIVNDDLEKAYKQLTSIITAKRMQNVKQNVLDDFVANM